jgi:hypothetical protein
MWFFLFGLMGQGPGFDTPAVTLNTALASAEFSRLRSEEVLTLSFLPGLGGEAGPKG